MPRFVLHYFSHQRHESSIPEENRMSNGKLNWIANLIWGIADDVLRDVYVRGKYRDVILPMTVIRHLDAVQEPTKQTVLSMKQRLDGVGITNQDAALRQAAGQAFYNTSPFTWKEIEDILLRIPRPSTTPRRSPCATCEPAPRRSSSKPT
jgi:hypothetical protein